MFTDFKEFFSYYIGVVKSQLPDYEKYLPDNIDLIHKQLKPLNKEQTDELNIIIRNIIKIPDGIMLVYDKFFGTFYSTYDKSQNRVVIGYPTVAYYMQRFPSLIKAAIKHEMGHIVNKDIFVRVPGHSICINMCMDARINQNIPHEDLDRLARCLQFSDTESHYVKADEFYNKILLPPVSGGYSWQTAHGHYHMFDEHRGGSCSIIMQDDDCNPSDIDEIISVFGKKPEVGKGESETETEKIEKQPGDATKETRNLKRLDEQVSRAIETLEKMKGLKMDKEHKKIVEEAIAKLNELHQKINSGQRDSISLKQEYNDIIMSVQNGLYDVIHVLQENGLTNYWKHNNSIDISEFPSCGVLDNQPVFDAVDEAIGTVELDNIISEIKNNPVDFSDLQDIASDTQSGFGVGDVSIRIIPPDIGLPKWISELISELKLFKQRIKTKVYYDPESLVRGIPAKQKEKRVLSAKTLWVLLDTSGSMLATAIKGKRVLDVLAAYIPPIANKFQGELWEIDAGAPTNIINLKDLTKSKMKGILIKGGGGTRFNKTFRILSEKRKEIKEKYGKNAEFMTVLITDAIVEWDFPLPENLIIVTTSSTSDKLPKLDEKKNQKAIIVN